MTNDIFFFLFFFFFYNLILRQIQRERESLGCHGCQKALTREVKRDNEGPI